MFAARGFQCDSWKAERSIGGDYGTWEEDWRNLEGENLIDLSNFSFESFFFTQYRWWKSNTGEFDQSSITDYVMSSDRKTILPRVTQTQNTG